MTNIIAEKKQLTYYYFYAIYNYIFFFLHIRGEDNECSTGGDREGGACTIK